MNASELNERLQNVYQRYLEKTYALEWPEGVSAPLLMHVFEEYTTVPCKILVVGQETHRWGQMSTKPGVPELQSNYARFCLGKAANYGEGRKPRCLTSPFWNFSRALFYNFNNQANGIIRKTNGFLWTNISKFDAHATTPSQELQEKNRAGFELLKTEIEIVRPDVVVFLTGTKYNHWLDELFNCERRAILDNNYLSQLVGITLADKPLMFQTMHPRTLVMNKRYHDVLTHLQSSCKELQP